MRKPIKHDKIRSEVEQAKGKHMEARQLLYTIEEFEQYADAPENRDRLLDLKALCRGLFVR